MLGRNSIVINWENFSDRNAKNIASKKFSPLPKNRQKNKKNLASFDWSKIL